jgi:hypothetical protein
VAYNAGPLPWTPGKREHRADQGLCGLEIENLTPRIRELLSMTNLQQLFTK